MNRLIRPIVAIALLGLFVLASQAKDDDDVAALIKQLKDNDAAVRLKAAKTLGTMGAKAKPAIAALFEALKDPDEDVRSVVQNAIASIAAGGGFDKGATTKAKIQFKFGGGADRPIIMPGPDGKPVLMRIGPDGKPKMTPVDLDDLKANPLIVPEGGKPGEMPVIPPRNVPRPDKHFDGKAKQEKSVKAALDWLAKNQRPDGSWATGMGNNRPALVATTSFAGLALMASRKKQYANNVSRAVAYVADNILQDRSPKFPGMEQMDQSNWKVAIGGFFLCEYYSTQKKLNPKFKSVPLQRTIEAVVVDAGKRMETSGGWGHTARIKNPLGYIELEIMSNWMLAMFGAAKELKFKVPEQKVDKAVAYISDCCNKERGDVGYSHNPGQKGFGCPCRTGGAIFAFGLLNRQEEALFPLMATSFKANIADSNGGHGSLAIGYLTSALGARQLGDEVWQEFKDRFFEQILDHAEKNGSFSVIKGESPQAQANADGMVGSAYTTAIYALMLQLENGNLRFMGSKPE